MSAVLTESEVEQYIRLALKQWGLYGEISVVWTDTESRLGCFKWWQNRIDLSRQILKSFRAFSEVFNHELCHALDYKERGTFLNDKGRNDHHGANFKKWCKIVGVRYFREYSI